jgi:hypothetical protein
MGSAPCRTRRRCNTAGSLALLLVWTCAAASAQAAPGETPVAPGALDAPPAPLVFGDDPSRRLLLNGFGVASFGWNAATGESSFEASAFALSAFKSISDHLEVFAQLTASRVSSSPFLADRPQGSRDVATDIDNLQIRWLPSSTSGLDFTFGKFDSPLALERDDAPLNFQATPSFTFDFARPVKFTGLAVHDAFSPVFEGWAIVANGWDVDTDNNRAKTVALYGLLSPSLAAHVGLGVIHGAEKDGTSRDPRTTVVATLLFQPTPRVVWGAESVAGSEPHSGADGGTARWYGEMLFVHARCGRHWAATLRGDLLDDPQGARTGARQVLKSLTLSPQYLVGGSFYGIFRYLDRTSLRLPELAVRLDLRLDRSTEPVFAANAANAEAAGRRDHASATLQTVFVF